MLDTTDRDLIELLRENARRSYSDLGRRVNLSGPAVRERLRKLEAAGVIRAYTVRLEPKKLGLGVGAVVFVNVRHSDEKRFEIFVKGREEVLECWHTVGPSAFMVRIQVRSLNDLEAFVGELMRFGQTTTHVLLSEVEATSQAS